MNYLKIHIYRIMFLLNDIFKKIKIQIVYKYLQVKKLNCLVLKLNFHSCMKPILWHSYIFHIIQWWIKSKLTTINEFIYI